MENVDMGMDSSEVTTKQAEGGIKLNRIRRAALDYAVQAMDNGRVDEAREALDIAERASDQLDRRCP